MSDAASSHWGYGEWRRAVSALEWRSVRPLPAGAVRQRALDRAWMAHPERFVRGRLIARQVPSEVWINRPEQEPANNVPQAAAS